MSWYQDTYSEITKLNNTASPANTNSNYVNIGCLLCLVVESFPKVPGTTKLRKN